MTSPTGTYPFVEQDLTVYRGQTLRIPFGFKQVPSIGGVRTPVDLTGGVVTMIIAWPTGPWGAGNTVTKTSPASGVTITSAVNGLAEALFSPSDIANVPAGVFARWELTFTSASGDVTPYGAGYINMKTVP